MHKYVMINKPYYADSTGHYVTKKEINDPDYIPYLLAKFGESADEKQPHYWNQIHYWFLYNVVDNTLELLIDRSRLQPNFYNTNAHTHSIYSTVKLLREPAMEWISVKVDTGSYAHIIKAFLEIESEIYEPVDYSSLSNWVTYPPATYQISNGTNSGYLTISSSGGSAATTTNNNLHTHTLTSSNTIISNHTI